MPKTNFRQQKRQRELVRKERQAERLARRGERLLEEAPVAAAPDAVPIGASVPAGADVPLGADK